MVILKEQEATEYLDKARSCIHPEDNFCNLQLISKMLEIESAFIDHLTSSGNSEITKIEINSSGFPELASWLVDIKGALHIYDNLKTERGKNMLPWLRQFANVSPEGVVDEGEKLTRKFSSDYKLSQAISVLTSEQRKYLIDLNTHNNNLPLIKDPTRGFMIVKFIESPFQSLTFDCNKREYYTRDQAFQQTQFKGVLNDVFISERVGLKYINSVESFIFCLFLDEHSRIEYVRILSQKYSLRDASSTYTANIYLRDRFFGNNNWCMSKDYTDLSEPTKPIGLEQTCQNMPHNLTAALMNADTTELSPQSTDLFLALVPKIKAFFIKTQDFFNSTLDGGYRPEHFQSQNFAFAQEMHEIFSSLPNDQLKATVQLALAEGTRSFESKIKTLSEPRELAQIETQRKKRFALLPWSH